MLGRRRRRVRPLHVKHRVQFVRQVGQHAPDVVENVARRPGLSARRRGHRRRSLGQPENRGNIYSLLTMAIVAILASAWLTITTENPFRV